MNAGMFGQYQIVSQLGRGAMGTVYRAIDPAIERTVAIKTLDPERLDDNLDEEFGRCLLGLPNHFAARRLPAP